MLKSTVTADDIKRDLIAMDKDNFSIQALEAIVQFYEEIGGEQEYYPLDIDYTFMELNLTQDKDKELLINDYGYLVEGEKFDDKDEKVEAIREAINDMTPVVSYDENCFVFEYNF